MFPLTGEEVAALSHLRQIDHDLDDQFPLHDLDISERIDS